MRHIAVGSKGSAMIGRHAHNHFSYIDDRHPLRSSGLGSDELWFTRPGRFFRLYCFFTAPQGGFKGLFILLCTLCSGVLWAAGHDSWLRTGACTIFASQSEWRIVVPVLFLWLVFGFAMKNGGLRNKNSNRHRLSKKPAEAGFFLFAIRLPAARTFVCISPGSDCFCRPGS